MMLFNVTHDPIKVFSFLKESYFDLNWGEKKDRYIDEALDLFSLYDGKLIYLENRNKLIGGMLHFYVKKHKNEAIGYLHIKKEFRGKHYSNFFFEYLKDKKFYFFFQEKLYDFYHKKNFIIKKINDKDFYIGANYETKNEQEGPYF